MICVDNIHIRLGTRPILRGVNLNIREGECLTIVGPNGCGKTTLLRILGGLERADSGQVRMPNWMTVGYLPQEADLDVSRSIEEELLDAFADAQAALAEMTLLEGRMSSVDPASPEHDRLLHRYGECQHLVEHYESYSLGAQVQRVAAGLGFAPGDMARSCREFSGGWQMRVLLAKLLLRAPDVLLLDEPTNHLDLESTLWLEEWIKRCGRTVVMVSHERATMDRLADRIVCLEHGTADVYTGDYSSYLEQSALKREKQWVAFKRQQDEIASMEGFIRRFRYTASRASLVQSRIKQLAKIERVERPFHPTAIRFDFPPAPRSYHEVLTLKDLGHSYGELQVFSGVNLAITRGEKVGLVGVNGAGKSTLLRIMTGREAPTAGECRLGRKVERSYFAQYDTQSLVSDTTVLAALEASAPAGQAQRARDVAGAFLFSGDDVEKPLRALSGGERTRFRLAQMLFSPANLLLLDEPTNHLDVSSRATVERALHAYAGTLVVVSHDRVFMDRVTDRMIEIEHGEVRLYPGKYSDYLAHKRKVLAEREGLGEAPGPGDTSATGPTVKELRIREHKNRKAEARRRRAMERRIEKLERDIEQHEARVAELEFAMADPAAATDYDRLEPMAEEHRLLKAAHARMLGEWERLHEQRDLGEGWSSSAPMQGALSQIGG